PRPASRRSARSRRRRRCSRASVGEAAGQDEEEQARRDPTHCGVREQQRKPLYSHPVPVVEAEADIARCQSARCTFLRNPQPPSLEQRREGLTASIDFDPILTLSERDEHGTRGPPNVAAPREFPVERGRSDKEEDKAEGRKNEPNARGHGGPPLADY